MAERLFFAEQSGDEYTNRLLCLALDVGEGMLKNGGEINRVEDTIERICYAYGAAHVEVFGIPSLILAAIRMPDGSYSSQTRRIQSVGNNLLRLELFNGISRTICQELPDLDTLDRMIRDAKKKPTYPKWLRCLAFALAAGAFAVFFGGDVKDGAVAALIGTVLFFVDLLPFRTDNVLAKTLIQSFVAGVFASLAVRVGLGSDEGIIMIGTIMLLIPGLAFGTALRDLLCGDILAGTLKTLQCVLVALMIAAGYLLAIFLMQGVFGGVAV